MLIITFHVIHNCILYSIVDCIVYRMWTERQSRPRYEKNWRPAAIITISKIMIAEIGSIIYNNYDRGDRNYDYDHGDLHPTQHQHQHHYQYQYQHEQQNRSQHSDQYQHQKQQYHHQVYQQYQHQNKYQYHHQHQHQHQ